MAGTAVPCKCVKCGKEIDGKFNGQYWGIQMAYIGNNGPYCPECAAAINCANVTNMPLDLDWLGKDKCCYRCGSYFICHPLFSKDAKPEGVKSTELKFRIGWRNKDINKRFEWKNDTTVTINGDLEDVENLLKHLKTMKPNTPIDDTWQEDWEWTIA